MNFKAVQDPPSLKLYRETAVPLAVVTTVLPVIGARVLRWMVFAPRTSVRLLLVLFIYWIALATPTPVEAHGAYNDVIRLCLQVFTFVW